MRPKRFNFNQACCYDDDANPPSAYHHSCQMSLFNSGMAVGNEPALPCLMLREIAPSRNRRPRIFSAFSAKPWCDGGNNSANYPHPTRKREVKCLRRPRSIHPELKKKSLSPQCEQLRKTRRGQDAKFYFPKHIEHALSSNQSDPHRGTFKTKVQTTEFPCTPPPWVAISLSRSRDSVTK